MKETLRSPRMAVALCVMFIALVALPWAAELVTTKPEEVGLSTERLARINAMMQKHIAAGDISGGVTLVARKGRIAHLEAHGVMDTESKKPMSRDAVFRIASMTKPVAGVADHDDAGRREAPPHRSGLEVHPAIQGYEGRRSLSRGAGSGLTTRRGRQRVDRLPAPRFYTVPAEREITIRDLLTHTSGLVSGPMSNSEARKAARTPTDTLADYIPRLGSTPLEFQPGTRWAYSAQAGFDTLGRIVEIVSGQNFDQFLRQRLFDPLGMKDVSFYATETLEPRMPMAYIITPKGLQKNPNPSSMQSRVYFMGAGGLISTAEEYFKFGQMLLGGGEFNGRRILSPRTVDLMAAVHISDTLPGRPVGEAYGLSVRVVNHAVAGGSRLSDGSFGWSGAYGTHFWVDPKEELVAILMIQTPVREMRPEFENAVMQAIVK